MPSGRLTLLVGTIVIAAGIAVAAVLVLSARDDNEISLMGIDKSELAIWEEKLLPPDGDPVITAEQARAIVLSRPGEADVREVVLVRVVDDYADPPLDTLAWAVNLDPATVSVELPERGSLGINDLCCPNILGDTPVPTPVPTPLGCGRRTIYDVEFVDALTGESLFGLARNELFQPAPGETCPPTPVWTPPPATPSPAP